TEGAASFKRGTTTETRCPRAAKPMAASAMYRPAPPGLSPNHSSPTIKTLNEREAAGAVECSSRTKGTTRGSIPLQPFGAAEPVRARGESMIQLRNLYKVYRNGSQEIRALD